MDKFELKSDYIFDYGTIGYGPEENLLMIHYEKMLTLLSLINKIQDWNNRKPMTIYSNSDVYGFFHDLPGFKVDMGDSARISGSDIFFNIDETIKGDYIKILVDNKELTMKLNNIGYSVRMRIETNPDIKLKLYGQLLTENLNCGNIEETKRIIKELSQVIEKIEY